MACDKNLLTLLTGTPTVPGSWQLTTSPVGFPVTLRMYDGAGTPVSGDYMNLIVSSNTQVLDPTGGGTTVENLWWDPTDAIVFPGCNQDHVFVFTYTPDAAEGGCISPGTAIVTWTIRDAFVGGPFTVDICDNSGVRLFADLVNISTPDPACAISTITATGTGNWTCVSTSGPGVLACPATPPLTLGGAGNIDTNHVSVAGGQTYTVRFTKDHDSTGTCPDCITTFDLIINILATGSAGGPGTVFTCV